jgi:plastocyanin
VGGDAPRRCRSCTGRSVPASRSRSRTRTGKKVATLRPGKYTFVVRDEADIHNFTLNGPGTKNKTIMGTSFVGTKTVTLTLKHGTYTFYCTVHPTITGKFKVT